MKLGEWTYKERASNAHEFELWQQAEGGMYLVGMVSSRASADFICEMCNGVELNELRSQLDQKTKELNECIAEVRSYVVELSDAESTLELQQGQIAYLRSQLVKQSWQPIADFVPGHDNPNVLVVDRGVVSEAYYNGETDNWWLANTSEHDFDHAEAIYPTHWMPMPALPLPDETGDTK